MLIFGFKKKTTGKRKPDLDKRQELARAMEAVDLQAKQMGEQSYELKTEVPLSVRKVVQKSTKLLSSQTRSLVRGDAFDVVKMGMMAEIHAAQTKTRAGAAKSSGGRKREAAVNKYLQEVVVDDTDDDDDDALGLFTAEDSEGRGMHQFKCH